MINSENSQQHLIAIDSTRSTTHGTKRFINTILNGLMSHTDLKIILFVDTENFDSYEGKRIQIIRIRMNRGYLIRTLNAILIIPIMARWYRAVLLYSPWDIGPVIKLVPFILGIHSPNSVTPKKYKAIKANLIHEFLSTMSARKAIAVEFPSKSAAKAIGDHMHIEHDKRNVIYHGAEISTWKKIINQTKLSEDENNLGEYFIYWSWFYPAKNVEILIHAYAQFITMQQASEKIKLVCIGKFVYRQYKDKIFDLVEALGLSDNIIFLENVDDEELVKLIYHAKTMVMPSLYETFGWFYVEGRLFNKPFIVADTEVAREITEGQCVYFNGNDASDLASKMIMATTRNDLSWNYQIADVFHEEHAAKNLANFFKRCSEVVIAS